ncbi:hypothetical protein DFJ74DRAFT_773894 [Hyaloraphidium curvatum]|nr:hypothetical protein DFJ74DRAFT_773894 [Hyaloraphidium curvatum]
MPSAGMAGAAWDGGGGSQRLLFRGDSRPASPRARFGSPADADADAAGGARLRSPAREPPGHASPRSPESAARSDDEKLLTPGHRRKSLNPTRSLPAAPADEEARAKEGFVVLDVYTQLRTNPNDLLYDRDQRRREDEYQKRMDYTFNPVPAPAPGGPVPGSAPNSATHSPAKPGSSTPAMGSSPPAGTQPYRRARIAEDGFPPHPPVHTSHRAVDAHPRRDRADSGPRRASSPRRRQSFSHGSSRSPPGAENDDDSEDRSLSSESSSSGGSPNSARPPAPRKRKDSAGEAGGPPKRRGRKPNVSKLVREFLPNHTKVLNGVDQLSANLSDFQKLKSDASETAGAPMVTWKGHPLPVDEGQEGYYLLTEEEKQICSILRLLPVQYLAIKDALLSAYEQRKTPFKKREAQKMCRVDVNKTAKVYDWFRYLGWLPPEVFGRVEEDEL